MKIIKTIVNAQHKLIGFEVEGQSWEFGGIGNQKVTTQIALENMYQQKFKNSQIEMKNNNIVEQSGFRLRNLPMMMLKDDSLVPIDNKITLVNRVLVDGKLAGFDVIIGGVPKRLSSQNIIANAGWFNPDNFVIRYRDNARYMVGKPGMSIEKLPEISLTSAPVTNKRNRTRTVTEGKGREYSVQVISPFDMISLTEILQEIGGQFIYLPGVNYNRISSPDKELSKDFRKTGVEISGPTIDYSEKTVNVSIPFKQIGQLIVNVNGIDKTYYPFAYKKKTVFEAGKLNSPHLGIAIPTNKVEYIQSRFGASMSLSAITDPMTNMYVKTFMQVKNPDEISLLALNTENLSAMSLANAKKYRRKESEIKAYYKKLITTKVCLSYIRGVMKDAEATAKETTGKAPKPLYGLYRGLPDYELDALVEAGVDVFSGAFTKQEESTAGKSSTPKNETDTKKIDISVEYGIAGYKTLPTYKAIKDGKLKAGAYDVELEQISKFKAELDKMDTVNKVYDLAKAIYDRLTKEKDEIVKNIWLSNMASLTLAGFKGFSVANPVHWRTTKPLLNGIAYSYDGKEAEGLTLNLVGLVLK